MPHCMLCIALTSDMYHWDLANYASISVSIIAERLSTKLLILQSVFSVSKYTKAEI